MNYLLSVLFMVMGVAGCWSLANSFASGFRQFKALANAQERTAWSCLRTEPASRLGLPVSPDFRKEMRDGL